MPSCTAPGHLPGRDARRDPVKVVEAAPGDYEIAHEMHGYRVQHRVPFTYYAMMHRCGWAWCTRRCGSHKFGRRFQPNKRPASPFTLTYCPQPVQDPSPPHATTLGAPWQA